MRGRLTGLALGLLVMVSSAPTWAMDDSAILHGIYNCEIEGKSRHFASGIYTLSISRSERTSLGQKAVLTSANGRRLMAQRNDQGYLIVREGDLLPSKNRGYAMISSRASEKGDFMSLEYFVAVKVSQGSYENTKFVCGAAGEVRLAQVTETAFFCVSQAVKGQSYRLQFRVRNLSDDNSIGLVELDEEGRAFKISPKTRDLEVLNENTSIGVRGGNLEAKGDSDGFQYAGIVIYGDSGFTKGYIQTKSGSEKITELYAPVICRNR